MEGSRDVGGEGVQQALLRMMEGSVITVQAKGAVEAPPVGGEGRSRSGQRSLNVGGRKSNADLFAAELNESPPASTPRFIFH